MVACVLLAATALASAGRAQLLVHKAVAAGSAVVEKRPATVVYTVINVGDGVATDISLSDASMRSKKVDCNTTLPHKIETLASGARYTLYVSVTPSKAGRLPNGLGKVTYRNGGKIKQEGFSNDLADKTVQSEKEHRKSHEYHAKEFFIYWCIAMGPILVPYMHKSSKEAASNKGK